MRGWLPLGILAVAVGALSLWLWQRPANDAHTGLRVSERSSQQITRIRLAHDAPRDAAAPDAARNDDRVLELERREGGWRMTAPFHARVDGLQIERLLAITALQANARYPADNLARYGLDAPRSTLMLDGETFRFGAVNTVTREQYVLARGSVYAVPLSQRQALPREAEALLSRALFAPEEKPVSLTLPGFTARITDGQWMFDPPIDAGADARNAWGDAWRRAAALSAERHDGRAVRETARVELQDGGTVELAIVQTEPELVLLRRDEGVQYRFLPEVGRRLLSPPQDRAAPS